MKTVYYIRHAKSSWNNYDLQDIDRPLNSRGRSDAPMMAKKLSDLESQNRIDGILSSTSERTRETLAFFADEFEIPDSRIIFDENLYHADSVTLIEALYQLPPDMNKVMLFSHNPGITFLANLIEDDDYNNIPTCGIYKVLFQTNSWQKVDLRNASIDYFIYPKMFKKV